MLILALGMGCEKERTESTAASQGGQAGLEGEPIVVTTTTMLETTARAIGGDAVVVKGIMQAGGDPHLYQPTPSDAKLVTRSKLVLTSGLYLEGWADDLVRNAGGERPVVVASEGVDPIKMEGSPGGVDPHFWFDLQAWRIASSNIADALVELVGPETAEAEQIRQRAEEYTARLEAMHKWTGEQLATIPADRRVLITSHDAFNYFGRAYDIDVVGIQGVSTEQEASQRDVANMIERVRERDVPAIFVESSVNPALIKQVARETGAKALGPLFSDSVGTQDSGAETFEKMFRANVRQIVEGLGGEFTPFEQAME